MTKFILSIDGGGIRGIIPAVILRVLQKKLADKNKRLPLHRYFHMIAGTSTGAIISAGLTCPKPGKPEESAADPDTLVEVYRNRGKEIFDTSIFRKLANLGGIVEERYDARPLENILIEMLGKNTEIGHALSTVLITGYDIKNRSAVFMTNADKKNERFRFWQAVRGSSAAPTYFEPALVEDLSVPKSSADRLIAMIDGGVFANDPGIAAYVEGSKLGWRDNGNKMVILSIGTGSANRPIPYQEARNWGAAGWINPFNNTPLISVLMQGQASTASYQLNKLLNGDQGGFRHGGTTVTKDNRADLHYFRIDAPLTGVSDALDDATRDNIDKLESFAKTLARTYDMALDEIAERLSAT